MHVEVTPASVGYVYDEEIVLTILVLFSWGKGSPSQQGRRARGADCSGTGKAETVQRPVSPRHAGGGPATAKAGSGHTPRRRRRAALKRSYTRRFETYKRVREIRTRS